MGKVAQMFIVSYVIKTYGSELSRCKSITQVATQGSVLLAIFFHLQSYLASAGGDFNHIYVCCLYFFILLGLVYTVFTITS